MIDGPSPLLANGLPYVFTSFTGQGRLTDEQPLFTGGTVRSTPPHGPARIKTSCLSPRSGELPVRPRACRGLQKTFRRRLWGLNVDRYFLHRPLIPAAAAVAAKRVALVIGNNAYETCRTQKAVNDAEAISQELAKLGFDVVSAENVGRRAMSRALVELESKIETGDTALIYFAGHGFAVDGTNYLLPVDVPEAGPGEEGLVRDASFAANGLRTGCKRRAPPRSSSSSMPAATIRSRRQGERSIGLTRGLTRMDPAEGMFVLFSAGQGQSALDRLSDTRKPQFRVHPHAAERAGAARFSMVQIAKRTQSEVRELAAKVDRVQVPAYYDQIVGELYLAPEGAARGQGHDRHARGRRRQDECFRRPHRSRRSRRCRQARSRS